MESILLASIVWVVFLISNIAVGFCMYRLGLHGRIKSYSDKFNEDDAVGKVASTLGGGYIPGSEFNPFETQPMPRYKYLEMDDDLDEDQDYGFAPDPVTPRGGEEIDGESERKTGQGD